MPNRIRTWLFKPVILVASLAAAFGFVFAAAGTASASTTFTATTHLTNRLDGGHNTLGGGIWATDDMHRTATLVDLGPDVNRSGYDTFSASLTDTGTFTTNSNVGNPNGLNATTPITGTVTGSVNGTGSYTQFDAPHNTADAGLVPSSMDGNVVSSGNWPSLFFPKGTDFECPGAPVELQSYVTVVNPYGTGGCGGESAYSYTYKSCSEQWLDANTDNDGNAVGETPAQQAVIGGISGKACPAPAPTPSQTTPPVTTTVPVGGVQTGGGLPVKQSGDGGIAILLAVIGAGVVIAAGSTLLGGGKHPSDG